MDEWLDNKSIKCIKSDRPVSKRSADDPQKNLNKNLDQSILSLGQIK